MQALTVGFLRPDALQDSGRLFHEINSFDVAHTDPTSKRKVLCVGHAVEKKHFVLPIVLSFIIVVVLPAVIVGVLKRSVSLGAELGGFIGIAIGLLWAYVFWSLDQATNDRAERTSEVLDTP